MSLVHTQTLHSEVYLPKHNYRFSFSFVVVSFFQLLIMYIYMFIQCDIYNDVLVLKTNIE
jgi:hypothetical protein